MKAYVVYALTSENEVVQFLVGANNKRRAVNYVIKWASPRILRRVWGVQHLRNLTPKDKGVYKNVHVRG